ncbi:hypothetical protein KIW84_021676 [Lathyrus oleraceus]|uniref:Uncharacterized protein n=1 Tax=Pisum sativum TaxID=3888 RepID=A0A9D4YD06_PEA|nr:hypothetical protein KIW84_021676 [Pisum sativum]
MQNSPHNSSGGFSNQHISTHQNRASSSVGGLPLYSRIATLNVNLSAMSIGLTPVRFQTDISTEAAKKPEGNEAFLAYQAGRQGAFGSNNVQPPNAMQLPQQSRKSTDSAQLHGSNQDAQLRGQNSEQQQMLNPSIPCGSKQVSERKHTGKKKQKVLENPSTSSSRFQCSPNDTMVLLKLVSFTRKPPHLHLLRLHSGFEWQCQHHKGEYLQKRIDQSHCVIFFLRFDGRQQQEVGMKKNM